MKKIGIFYGSSTGNTEFIADRIQAILGENVADVSNIDSVDIEDINQYKYLIFGTSTWGVGNLQDDWEVFIPMLKKVNFKNKKIALYGLGDQEVYADTFVDGMGKLYDLLHQKAIIVGAWPTDSYQFFESEAVRDGKFVGLALDYDNEPQLTEKRLKLWVNELKKEFK